MVLSSASPAFATSFTRANVLKDKAGSISRTTVSTTIQAQTDLPFPSWWNGICDTNNYYPAIGVSATLLIGIDDLPFWVIPDLHANGPQSG
jgi:hypothetical protein